MASLRMHAVLPGTADRAMCGATSLALVPEVTSHVEHVTCVRCLSGIVAHAHAVMGVALAALAKAEGS